jgi:hypothetical protein
MDCLGDPYEIGIDPRYREWVKKALNSLINAGPRGIAEPGGYDPIEVGIAYKELLERVAQHHNRISAYFYTGSGLDLQFVDSCIAEKVMLHFADQGIPCLPVHDSFLVQQRYQKNLVEVMHSAFENVVGRKLTGDAPERLIKVKRRHQETQ